MMETRANYSVYEVSAGAVGGNDSEMEFDTFVHVSVVNYQNVREW